MNKLKIYTVGHSTRPLDAFVDMLRGFEVDTLVDIRTIPRSRTNPQYNLDVLPGALAVQGIGHVQIAQLGGRRKKSKVVADHTNGFWDNRSFHNYADYALSDEFDAGLEQLLAISKARCCAIMCAEAVWWRCHRRIVTDYLLVRDVEVAHIMDKGKVTSAVLNPAARVQGLKVVYPTER